MANKKINNKDWERLTEVLRTADGEKGGAMMVFIDTESGQGDIAGYGNQEEVSYALGVALCNAFDVMTHRIEPPKDRQSVERLADLWAGVIAAVNTANDHSNGMFMQMLMAANNYAQKTMKND